MKLTLEDGDAIVRLVLFSEVLLGPRKISWNLKLRLFSWESILNKVLERGWAEIKETIQQYTLTHWERLGIHCLLQKIHECPLGWPIPVALPLVFAATFWHMLSSCELRRLGGVATSKLFLKQGMLHLQLMVSQTQLVEAGSHQCLLKFVRLLRELTLEPACWGLLEQQKKDIQWGANMRPRGRNTLTETISWMIHWC